jgi:hypothetical protein
MRSPTRRRSKLDLGFKIYAVLLVITTLTAWAYTFLTRSGELHRDILIAFSFVTLGMLIKYGDEAFDVRVFSRTKTLALVIPGALLMGGLILTDVSSGVIFTGLLLALLMAGKYDNSAFRIGFVVAFSIAILAYALSPQTFHPVGVAVVFMAALADEHFSDRADRKQEPKLMDRVLQERPFLKIAVFALCALGILSSFLYFFAFLGFDFGYSLVERYGYAKREADAPV